MTEPTSHAPAERSSFADVIALAGRVQDECALLDMLQFVPDMVMILNPQRQIVHANRAVMAAAGVQSLDQVLGYRPGELLNCRHSRETPGGCGTTPACKYCGAVTGILKSQSGMPAVEECRISVVSDELESALDLRIHAHPVVFGEVPCTFLAIQDIADEKRRVFLERIFLHDVMNTATAIRGFTRLLESDVVDESEREEFLGRLGTLSDRIVGEIDAHRELMAAERGSLDVHPKRVYARHFVDDIFRSYNRPDLLNRRWLQVAEDSADVVLDTDPVLLGRVVGNMVKNAIEASQPGDTVTMGCRESAGGVDFWVHNPAVMPDAVRLQVFKRSFSTKGEGRGLGTYSMKYLSERYLGGRVSFASVDGHGTTFVASFPWSLAAQVAA